MYVSTISAHQLNKDFSYCIDIIVNLLSHIIARDREKSAAISILVLHNYTTFWDFKVWSN